MIWIKRSTALNDYSCTLALRTAHSPLIDMRSPYPLPHLFFLFISLILLLAFIHIGILSIAFEKLGLSQGSIFILLFLSLIGSSFNLPLFTVRSELPPMDMMMPMPFQLGGKRAPAPGRTIIAINIGGGMIPTLFSCYLIFNQGLSYSSVLITIILITGISYYFSRPIQRLGIGMPILIAPVSAALIAITINPSHSAPLAYISGTLGVLIGADLLRLKDIRKMGVPFAAIGGAGTFDGIFITGIVAVLLA